MLSWRGGSRFQSNSLTRFGALGRPAACERDAEERSGGEGEEAMQGAVEREGNEAEVEMFAALSCRGGKLRDCGVRGEMMMVGMPCREVQCWPSDHNRS